jgi:hypothetical protein
LDYGAAAFQFCDKGVIDRRVILDQQNAGAENASAFSTRSLVSKRRTKDLSIEKPRVSVC